MDVLKINRVQFGEDESHYSEWIIANDILGNQIDIEIGFYRYSRCIALFADSKNLDKLDVPEGLTSLYCRGNVLKDLKLPSSLDRLHCDKEAINYAECKVDIVNIYYENIDKR
jgi:hypothetical protein